MLFLKKYDQPHRILITGCTGGLGCALFDSAQQRSQVVFAHYHNQPKLASCEPYIIGDIRDQTFLTQLHQFILDHNINTVINNAAIYSSEPFETMDRSTIEEVITVDLLGQILVTQVAYQVFKLMKNGLIVNINSLAGITPSANETVYAAAKHGFKGFSKSLQLEAIGTGVEFVDVLPGAMKTSMTKNRANYDMLLDPVDVANSIIDMIVNSKKISINEMVIRRKP